MPEVFDPAFQVSGRPTRRLTRVTAPGSKGFQMEFSGWEFAEAEPDEWLDLAVNPAAGLVKFGAASVWVALLILPRGTTATDVDEKL